VVSIIVARFGLGSVTNLIDQLDKSWAFISGLYPLLALFPNLFTPNDLDIFIPSDTPQPSPIWQWIEDICGYRNTAAYSEQQYPYTSHHNNHIRSVSKHENLVDGTLCSINIIILETPWVYHAVTRFPFTIAMNFISSTDFVSLYPKLTLAKKGLKLCTNKPDWINKYRNRGFNIWHSLFDWQDIPIHICRCDSNCLLTQQKITDPYTMFVPFDDTLASGNSRIEWMNSDLLTPIGWQFSSVPCMVC
jgi:hypothetical protein